MADGNGAAGGVVIDEKLLRDCIFIEGNIRPGLGDDAAQAKSTSSPSSVGAGRAKGGAARGALLATGSQGQGSGPQRVIELHEVTCLMLSYRRISSINNLVGVECLTKLHLDNNGITKIENLGHLKQLRWLDLSFNKITAITGMEQLTNLEDLSLHANQITVLEGLDSQTKLTCLSLGRNQIDALDDVAKYLHRFRHLRMLTLAGNKVEAQAHYRQRLLGYVGRLRFLDSRAVFEAEVAKAKDDLKEHLNPVDDADRKEDDLAQLARVAADEAAEYAKANCPDDRKFHHEIFTLEPEGRNVGALLDVDVVRDRVKDVLDPHQERFTAKAKELSEKMIELRRLKDADAADYNLTLTRAKARSDAAGRLAIRQFEKKLKKVIPFGLRARPDPDTYDEKQVSSLRSALRELRTVLLEREADQQDAYEALNKAYEDATDKHRVEAIEVLAAHFEELRGLEKSMFQDLSRRFDAWHDEKQRLAQDAAEGYSGSGSGDGHPRDKQALSLMDNREEFTKALQEWHDLHSKKLDEREENHKRKEEETFKAAQERNKRAEHERNRWRVGEVGEYYTRMSSLLDQWETWADVQ